MEKDGETMGIEHPVLESQLIGQELKTLAGIDEGFQQRAELDVQVQLRGGQLRIQVSNVKLSFVVPLIQVPDVVEKASAEKAI